MSGTSAESQVRLMAIKSIQDPSYLELVARLRAAREHLRVTQAELGARLFRPQSYVAKIEAGERRVDLVETLRLCDALGIALDDVVPGELRHLLRRRTMRRHK